MQKKGYRCGSCHYQGRQFPQGVCPACGSAAVERLHQETAVTTKRKGVSVVLLIILWAYLLFALGQKLIDG